MPCSFPAHRSVAGTRTGLKAARPGLTALTPALLPARLETGRDPGEKGRISPLTGPAPSGMTWRACSTSERALQHGMSLRMAFVAGEATAIL